jgi:hypothetical protein
LAGPRPALGGAVVNSNPLWLTIGDLMAAGSSTASIRRPQRHLYLDPEILRLPDDMTMPEVARHLSAAKGARNSTRINPIWATFSASMGGGVLSGLQQVLRRAAWRSLQIKFVRTLISPRKSHSKLQRISGPPCSRASLRRSLGACCKTTRAIPEVSGRVTAFIEAVHWRVS